MKILFTFPGQGTQHPGMLKTLPQYDLWRARVDAVLGEGEMARLDTPQALEHTRAVQLCLLIAGVAWAERLRLSGVRPDMVCGLSIGEYPAAVVAGALDFADALRLVARRGELMEQAWPSGYGLTAIMGLSRRQVESAMAGSDVWVANLNAEYQIVIAGSDTAMAETGERAKALGASRVKRLAVSVPSHCPLLDKPASELAKEFQSITLRRPAIAWLSGSSARVIWQPERIAECLANNMARTVRWQEAMVAAEERGVGLAVEMPPGGVLTCLARQAFRAADALSLERSGVEVICHVAARLSR
ncbi:malonyl CoA-acyl carrier protein transacylase [Salmonella enterica subsp. enterica serovar Choleraesuis]|nr:malonyl CoA-acyl carrier protein transacylase [Salmonella enterica subsp. enterica serovar Choleraesuis]